MKKHILLTLFGLVLFSCSNDNVEQLIRYQLDEQAGDDKKWIELNDIEVSSKSLELLKGKNVNILWLHNNNLDVIPENVYEMESLEHLSIQGSPKIQAVNKEINKLNDLRKLWIIGTDVETLPIELYDLNNLNELVINRNRLSTLSKEIHNLQNLKLLDLGENKLKSLPIEMSDLKSLEVVYLNGNSTLAFEDIIEKLESMNSIKRIYLHENNYNSIPTNLIKLNRLNNLEILNLQNNLFTEQQKDSIKRILTVKKIII